MKFDNIVIENENSEILNAYAITTLKDPISKKEYLLYTFDKDSDNIDVYASLIVKNNDVYKLENINNEYDWKIIQSAIKNIMGE